MCVLLFTVDEATVGKTGSRLRAREYKMVAYFGVSVLTIRLNSTDPINEMFRIRKIGKSDRV